MAKEEPQDALYLMCQQTDIDRDEIISLSRDEFRDLSRRILANNPIQHAEAFRAWQAHQIAAARASESDEEEEEARHTSVARSEPENIEVNRRKKMTAATTKKAASRRDDDHVPTAAKKKRKEACLLADEGMRDTKKQRAGKRKESSGVCDLPFHRSLRQGLQIPARPADEEPARQALQDPTRQGLQPPASQDLQDPTLQGPRQANEGPTPQANEEPTRLAFRNRTLQAFEQYDPATRGRDRMEDLNEELGHAYTPLHSASRNGQADIVRRLLTENANPDIVNTTNSAGRTALHEASSNGHEAIVSILLQHGANVNARTRCARTCLHLASAKGHASIMSSLLDNGADIDAQDDNGNTPIHEAYKWHGTDSDEYELLVRRGASISIQNKAGAAVADLEF